MIDTFSADQFVHTPNCTAHYPDIDVCICIYLYIYIHIHINLCIYIYLYIYIHIHINLCIYIYIIFNFSLTSLRTRPIIQQHPDINAYIFV